MYQSNAVWAVSHSTVLELFCTSAYSSHLFCKFLNLQSYSLELSSFQKTFSSLLFSPHGKVLKFINKLFRGFSWNLRLVMHCVFSKAHVILPKFQMCPRLEKGGSVFLLILSPFLPIFIFFSIRIGICLFIPLFGTWAFWGPLWFASQCWASAHVGGRPFIYSEIFIEPLTLWQFFHLISSRYFNSTSFFAESEVVLLLWKRSIIFQLSFGPFCFLISGSI